MYLFDELHPRREFLNGRSIAYWLGAVRSPLPTSFASATQLAAAMSTHYDIEEQACDEEHLGSVPELLFDVFMPVAPVSLAEAWSPIPLACQLLGSPAIHGIDQSTDWHRPAFGVFGSTFLGESDYGPTMEHDRHAFRLLRFACARALEQECDVLLVAQPGWSFKHCKKDGLMNPEVA